MQKLLLGLFGIVVLGVGGAVLYATLTTDVVEDQPQDLAGLVWIPGGEFRMGSNWGGALEESPVHEVEVDGFWIMPHEVTNAEFAEFVEATGYITIAEKPVDPATMRIFEPEELDALGDEIDRSQLKTGSVCSRCLLQNELDPNAPKSTEHLQWWQFVEGASWKHPSGPDSSIEEIMDHPVVHIAYDDALAYCEWAGMSLPTEAEWEYAARGGLDGKDYPWGDERKPGDKWMMNIYQGPFPTRNTMEDGFEFSAPVGSFPANGYGLYDMSGNVWEWTSDWYSATYFSESPKRNPKGPSYGKPDPNDGIMKRVTKGGSFLCSDNYCQKYRCAGRMASDPTSGTHHTGFRGIVRKSELETYLNAPRQQR